MSAFNKNDIPAAIDTLEKLGIWVGLALAKINPSQTAVEGSGGESKVAEFGIFNVAQTGKTRVITRQSYEIEDDFAYDGKKLWEQAKDFSSNSLPAGFTDAS
ncbi:MAG: glucose-6-phosphate dehydrogenase [Cyanobacteria bacterium P01_D01_bin.50]